MKQVEKQETPAPIFGRQMRSADWLFDPAYTPLNHGSYGAFPRAVRKHQRDLEDRIEGRSDRCIRYVIPDLLEESRTALAPLLGASPDEVVLVPNATTAVNTVLRNLTYDDGDVILYFSTAYPACEKTIQYVCETTSAEPYPYHIKFPIEDDDLIEEFKLCVEYLISTKRRVKIAMFDTIVTFPGVRMPWERLVAACRELKILSLIDGAHGVGHIDLTHLASVAPDFFTSNCYKWLYTPRACGVFYVPRRNQHLIRSTVPTSHGFLPRPADCGGRAAAKAAQNRFVNLFKWVSTVDQTPYLCIPAALAYRRDVCGGEEAIMLYCHTLARDGGKRVAELLGTEVMDNETQTLSQCCFTTVRLPLELSAEKGPEVVKRIMENCMNCEDTWVPAKFYNGDVWIRLSAQVYLEMADFEWAASVLQKLCDEIKEEKCCDDDDAPAAYGDGRDSNAGDDEEEEEEDWSDDG